MRDEKPDRESGRSGMKLVLLQVVRKMYIAKLNCNRHSVSLRINLNIKSGFCVR